MAARANEIPFFLKARTPKELRALMIKTNVKNFMTIQYFDIQFAQGSWWAWFYLPFDKYREDNDVTEST